MLSGACRLRHNRAVKLGTRAMIVNGFGRIAALALGLMVPFASACAQNWNDGVPAARVQDDARHRTGSVVCQAINYQPATCPADTMGNVRLVTRMGGDCTQGRTWSFDRRAIYMRNGCRAVFNYGPGVGGGGGYNPGYPGGGYPGGGYIRRRRRRCRAVSSSANRGTTSPRPARRTRAGVR